MWKPLLLRRLRPAPDLIFPHSAFQENTLCLCVYLCSHVEKSDDGGEYVYIFQPSDKKFREFRASHENTFRYIVEQVKFSSFQKAVYSKFKFAFLEDIC